MCYDRTDTGSTISVISSDLLQKMKRTTKVDIKKCDRQCMVANGSNINLETIVSVPKLRLLRICMC